MATVAHLNILKSGPDVWNQWREMNPGVRPDLCEVKLKGDHLRMFNLSRFNLSYANLHWAWMYETNLIEVNLQGADLRGANLALSLLHQANLRQANLSEANLSDADLFKANLRQAKLIKADLSGSRLEGANLNGAELEGADLSLSHLKEAQTKKGGRMFGSFPQQAFYNLLTRLATTSGPSLQEEPRRLVLEEFFNEADVPYDLDAVSNLWVSLGPEGWSEAVVYDAHLDVVERGYTDKVSYDNGRMIGMGVGDDLAAVTMMAFAAKAITAQKMPLKRALRLLFSVGEEGIGNLKGIRQVVSDYPEPPYLFIAFDLSFETYSITALGSKRYRVEVKCPGGHSWDDFGSPNAVEQLLDFMGLLKSAYADMATQSKEVITFNIGSIQGGQAINTIARFAEVRFEFRSTAPNLLQQMEQTVSDVAMRIKARQDVSLVHTLIGERPAAQPVHPERIEPLVRQLLIEQGEEIISKPRSTNMNIPLSMGWPSICMGLCRCRNYHREDEYLYLDSLPLGWELLNKLTQELVG